MSSSSAGAAAYNPSVVVNDETVAVKAPRTSQQQAYLDALAEQADASVAAIEQKIAGMQESLKAAKAEAKRARGDAQNEEN